MSTIYLPYFHRRITITRWTKRLQHHFVFYRSKQCEHIFALKIYYNSIICIFNLNRIFRILRKDIFSLLMAVGAFNGNECSSTICAMHVRCWSFSIRRTSRTTKSNFSEQNRWNKGCKWKKMRKKDLWKSLVMDYVSINLCTSRILLTSIQQF